MPESYQNSQRNTHKSQLQISLLSASFSFQMMQISVTICKYLINIQTYLFQVLDLLTLISINAFLIFSFVYCQIQLQAMIGPSFSLIRLKSLLVYHICFLHFNLSQNVKIKVQFKYYLFVNFKFGNRNSQAYR